MYLALKLIHGKWVMTKVCTVGDSGFFRLQGILNLKFQKADSGQFQFWSEPSEISKLRSSNTPETVAFTIP